MPQLGKLADLSPAQTRTALDAVVPALLHGFGASGATSAGAAQLTQFARDQQGVTSLGDQLRSEEASTKLSASGSKLLPAIFGDNLGRTIDCIATTSGISYNSAAALMHLVAPLAMGTIAGEARRLGLDGNRLTNFHGDLRSSSIQAMPTELGNCLGIQRPVAAAAGVRGAETARAGAAVAAPVVAAEPVRPQAVVEKPAADLHAPRTLAEPGRAKIPWWLWALPILALLGVGAWLLSLNRPALPAAPSLAVPTISAPAVPTVVPPAVPTVAAPTGAAPAAPAGAAPTALAGTTWGLERFQRPNVADVTPTDPRDYAVKFGAPADGRHGDADYRSDCNAGRGTYDVQGNSIALDTSAVPRAACGAGSMSNEFLSRLGDVSTYEIRDGKLYLNLKDNTGTMQFTPEQAS